MSKIITFYHKNCSDGSAAAAVVFQYLSEGITAHHEFVAVQYGDYETVEEFQKEFKIDSQTRVIVVDFSFNDEIHNHILDKSEHYLWLDHHKTALQAQCARVGVPYTSLYTSSSVNHEFVLDESYSGAMLAWNHFYSMFKGPVATPKLIRHVQDRDLWRFELEGTKELACFLHDSGMKLEQWVAMLRDDALVCDAIDEGAATLKVYQNQVKRLAKKAQSFRLCGHMGLAVNTGMHVSEVGNELAKQSGTFGACWFWAEDKVVVSLRSIGGFDVSEIAKQYGGGGHKAAAGFQTDLVTLQSLLLEGLSHDRANA